MIFALCGIFGAIQANRERIIQNYIHSSLARMVIGTSEEYAILVIEHSPIDKAYINAQDNYGDTALIVASRCGKIHVVRALLNKGADMGIKNSRGQDAASVASSNRIRAILALHEVED